MIEDYGKLDSEIAHDKALKGMISIPLKEESLVGISGTPIEDHIKGRSVRVFRPAKSAMQSGTAGVRKWRLEFETRERWENNLMGWASSGDPLSNTIVEFADKEDAIHFVKKNGWPYWVDDPKEKTPKPKSYALNFAWNRRTRKSTK
uniref:NADH dehydrogenase [ubiquinone] iron-sulfur protein 4, mitochondrial n=1 Tax=Caligus clemensi TaxID=344056 RepID=C1C1W3_CALCM|nr:NADH dehydrogenase iron-sulfur protein 4, mitochondrial precursor [Caligus clemensi]